ncbi:hypothetical protein BCV69DRAFT_245078 [Microstroma glucosiphilum]|uniref:RNI-like protein n=1 Tax=Pseudomicrostroma glucosiphilum TaxID=1684307 RepID=A0A316UBP6_9BASI|nr:hypothetical protein BCV69DRAFT_245078 [Pseudomicrostroma glucosiphilum]PWN22616.1 hypothetical protein BCV69DRAFT_245078 [Pseudomicrostroma glucosiphilum]
MEAGVYAGSADVAPAPTTFSSLPAEVISLIVRLIYLESIPRSYHRNLDLHGLPSTYSDGRRVSSPHSAVQATLWALCLTNRTLFAHARPLLYRRINVTLPYSFILLIRTLGAAALAKAYEQFQLTGKLNQDPDDPHSFTSIVAAAGFARVLGTSLKITRGPNQERQDVRRVGLPGHSDGAEEDELNLVWKPGPVGDGDAPTTQWTVSLHPLGADADSLQKCLRVVDFSYFRAHGLRRTVGENLDHRFVTSSRLLALLTAAPDLASFGASHTMDSALSVEVLEALLFRGGKTRRPARLRGVSLEKRKSGEQLALSAIDFTDCVSPVFKEAAQEFVVRHLNGFGAGRRTGTDEFSSEAGGEGTDEEDLRGRRGRGLGPALSITTGSSSGSRSATRSISRHQVPRVAQATRFPSIQRLSLSGISWPLSLLAPLVESFPNLTHLDLSRTKVDANLLDCLAASPTIQLQSLALAGCRQLTSTAITDLLVDSSATTHLVELSLEGSLLAPTPLTASDLQIIITSAPAFASGCLRYLDIGGCGMDDELLKQMPPQPCLLDLGLGASSGLTLSGVAQFLIEKAPNVQVMELTDSCYWPIRGEAGVSALDLSTHLITPCCTTPPLPLSMQLEAMGFRSPGSASTGPPPVIASREPTNLRVIGLNGPSLRSIRDGIGSWKVIWGAGKRGWVVDTSAGPDPEAKDESIGEPGEEQASSHLLQVADSRGGGRSLSSQRKGSSSRSRSRHRRLGYEPETPPTLSRSGSYGPRKSLVGSPAGSGPSSRSPSHGRYDASSISAGSASLEPRSEVVRHLPETHPRSVALQALSQKQGQVPSEVGWHSRKMEVLLGFGLMGRERGVYAWRGYCARD